MLMLSAFTMMQGESAAFDMMQGESAALQAGVQVNQEYEKLVLDALMQSQPADSFQLSGGSLADCGNCADWGDGLRTEWVTQCNSVIKGKQQPIPHRLYVQAAPGEMRLATTMITEI